MADAVCVAAVFLHDAVDDGLELFFFRAINNVAILRADQRTVGGNDHHVQAVNLPEFFRFGFRRAGHARELLMHAEIILEGDGGERLILALDLHAFFGLDRLMQPVGPPAPGHLAAGEFIHDDDLAVVHDVINVALIEGMRAEGLIDVVDGLHVRGVV